ncbi:MAG: hypothetical protein ABIH77_02545 [Pseudomonadota bacterium]
MFENIKNRVDLVKALSKETCEPLSGYIQLLAFSEDFFHAPWIKDCDELIKLFDDLFINKGSQYQNKGGAELQVTIFEELKKYLKKKEQPLIHSKNGFICTPENFSKFYKSCSTLDCVTPCKKELLETCKKTGFPLFEKNKIDQNREILVNLLESSQEGWHSTILVGLAELKEHCSWFGINARDISLCLNQPGKFIADYYVSLEEKRKSGFRRFF